MGYSPSKNIHMAALSLLSPVAWIFTHITNMFLSERVTPTTGKFTQSMEHPSSKLSHNWGYGLWLLTTGLNHTQYRGAVRVYKLVCCPNPQCTILKQRRRYRPWLWIQDQNPKLRHTPPTYSHFLSNVLTLYLFRNSDTAWPSSSSIIGML